MIESKTDRKFYKIGLVEKYMSNTRHAYLLYLIPLFVTTFILVIPVQTQGQPTSAVDSCFHVEAGAETLVCGGGMPESGDQEANSTSIEDYPNIS